MNDYVIHELKIRLKTIGFPLYVCLCKEYQSKQPTVFSVKIKRLSFDISSLCKLLQGTWQPKVKQYAMQLHSLEFLPNYSKPRGFIAGI